MKKYLLHWSVWLILAALIVAALVPGLAYIRSGSTSSAHAANVSKSSNVAFAPHFIGHQKPGPIHNGPGVDRSHLPTLTSFAGQPQFASTSSPHLHGALVGSGVNSYTTTSLYFDDMESSAPGWTKVGDSSGHSFWNLAQNPDLLAVPGAVNPLLVSYPDQTGKLPAAYSGSHAWWYGDNPAVDPQANTASLTYMGNENTWPPESSGNGGTTNGANSGSLISPSIDLTTVHNATLTFATWWEIEGLNPAHFDMMYVDVTTSGGTSWKTLGVLNPINNPLPLVNTYILPNPGGPFAYPFTNNGLDTQPSWQVVSANLSPYVGHHVQVRFRFDSVDQTSNGFRGWFVDDVGVYSTSTNVLPKVNSITPNIGLAGNAVTISGSGFGTLQGNSTVTFNGVSAVVQSWGNYGIVAIVPAGATSGPLVVTVNGVQTAPVNFTINAQISFYYGAAAPGGFSTTLTGQGFAPNEPVALYMDGVNGKLWTTVTATASGTVSPTDLYVPDAPNGMHLVLAIGQNSHILAGSGLLIFPSFSTGIPQVAAGQAINVVGHGYAANETVLVQLGYYNINGNNIGTLSCDYNGDCSGTVTIPLDSGVQGQNFLDGFGTKSQIAVAAPFTLTPGITITPNKFGQSSYINVYGGGFTANEPVQVHLGSATGTLEGTATSDSNGNIYFGFPAPVGLKVGMHTITVVRTSQTPASLSTQFQLLAPKLISTAGIHSGQSVQAALTGFQPFESVPVTWNANGGQQVTTFWTDSVGAATGTFTPPSALAGSYMLTAKGNTSGLQATSPLNIGPGILLSPNMSNPGSVITVNGGGYTPGETVNVYFQTTKNSVSTTVNTSGNFTVTLAIPVRYDPSVAHYVHAVSSNGLEKAIALFTFTPPQLYPNTIVFGAPFSLPGQGFAANEQVTIYWGYGQPFQKIIATAHAAADGTFNVSFAVPSEPNESNITIAAIGKTSLVKAIASANESVGIVLQPSSQVPVGSTVNVSGGSFGSNETVTVTLQSTSIATVTTDATGAFTTSFVVPNGTAGGLNWVHATGSTSGLSAQAELRVNQTVVLSPTTGPSGTQITVTGSYFSGYISVNLTWYDPSTNSSTNLGTANANPDSFTATVTAPANLTSGHTYLIEASDPLGDFGSAPFVAQ